MTSRKNCYFSFSYFCKLSSCEQYSEFFEQGLSLGWATFPPLSPKSLFSLAFGPASPGRGGHLQPLPLARPGLVFLAIIILSSSPSSSGGLKFQYPFPRWAALQGAATSSDPSSHILKTPRVCLNADSSWSSQGCSPMTHKYPPRKSPFTPKLRKKEASLHFRLRQ